MTEELLRQHIQKKSIMRTSSGMTQALVDILINGSKWREAAHKNDVSESGILRAMRRLGLKKSSP